MKFSPGIDLFIEDIFPLITHYICNSIAVGFIMYKKYCLLFFLVMLVCSASHCSFGAMLKVTIGERNLYLNNTAVKGDWKFEYSIKEDQQESTKCDFSKGPMLSYVTTVIEGNIYVPSPNKFLESSYKKNSKFQVEYTNPDRDKPEEVLFDGCRVTSFCKKKDPASGRDCNCYTFRAVSALKRK